MRPRLPGPAEREEPLVRVEARRGEAGWQPALQNEGPGKRFFPPVLD